MGTVVLVGFVLVGLIVSLFPEPPPTAAECEEQLRCLDYLAEHEDVARELVLEVHNDVLHQSEPRSTSARRQVDDLTIGYGGFWSPDGIPESMWDRVFTVESEDFSCRVKVNSMYADVEGEGITLLLAGKRASVEARLAEAREEEASTTR